MCSNVRDLTHPTCSEIMYHLLWKYLCISTLLSWKVSSSQKYLDKSNNLVLLLGLIIKIAIRIFTFEHFGRFQNTKVDASMYSENFAVFSAFENKRALHFWNKTNKEGCADVKLYCIILSFGIIIYLGMQMSLRYSQFYPKGPKSKIVSSRPIFESSILNIKNL